MALLSWNCHGFKHHVSELRDLINQYHPVCLALQETFLHEAKTAKIRRYSTLRKDYVDGDRASGGVALFTSHDYPSSPLNIHTNLQAVAARIHIHSLITVCSLYLPPNININQNSLNNLINQLPPPFILLGDLNGHSPLWGSPSTNSRGAQIEQLISDHDLCIFNSDEHTYFHQPSRTFHSLDLAIGSPNIFLSWKLTIDSYLHNSDHFPLILSHTTHSTHTQRIPRYNLESADWNAFQTLAAITEDMVRKIVLMKLSAV
jgi:hypothetical protein